MRLFFRRAVTILAIYAVAMHVILLGLTQIAVTGQTVNPITVICHDATPGDEAPGKPDLAPGQACEHCNLCGVAPPPEPATASIGQLLPARLLHVLRPASQVARMGIAFTPNLARGPPRFA
ncbi:MAG TPA: DUF2946 family protein [Pseudolabrys sp.]|nr:DUF2946 family protein [Pseudolabrys sp.]